ncbi:hypothetical protein BGW36DRAFT_429323 [Talaromyces proteolyticus]|uniref:LysM domain-containing protein n=1 Tax=Talaromyces proteolyticus TaxID=1131652 RepID=A0AAD4KN88_9EURO|nr:uncharacterized protein BGW36DRAFT_429323 [Talaromyces proteolyticus]KAH8695446.1 hypothetical protein BGW36DRAFT_429323 [Talaromyces proteolyticus]
MARFLVSLTSSLALAGAASAAIGPRDCSYSVTANNGDTCQSISDDWGITTTQFEEYNSQVGANCSNGVTVGQSYCVQWSGPLPTKTTVPAATTATTTTATATGNGAPSPTQSGIAANCTKYYQAVSGDSCSSIASAFGTFSVSDFESWNPAVGSSCSGLWAGYYYCVAIPGTPTSRPTTTTAPSGPSPTQSGIVSDCTKFYKAQSGDSCYSIATSFGTFSVSDFESWNPAVGSSCSGLFAGYYYCVAVPGTPTQPTSTAPSGPQPEQTGITSNCNKYYKVQSGDYCEKICQQYGISVSQFYSWNPAVGDTCQSLWVGYYVCVGV